MGFPLSLVFESQLQVAQPEDEGGLVALRADGLSAFLQLAAGEAGQRESPGNAGEAADEVELRAAAAARSERLARARIEREREAVDSAGRLNQRWPTRIPCEAPAVQRRPWSSKARKFAADDGPSKMRTHSPRPSRE